MTLADSLHVRLTARNAGGAVWLTKPRGKKGEVALGWRWLTADGQPLGGGAVPVRYDVYPGQRYEFDAWITPAVEPGRYRLELGLVSGGVGPFAERGTAPVTVLVDVAPR
jgi:hypothetical protein